MAEKEQEETNKEKTLQLTFPTGRVKRIMKLDKDINKINSDALFVVSNATELFVRFLAEKSSLVATEKKRKTIKVEHLRLAVKRHQPTADFLLDSLPMPPPPDKIPSKTVKNKSDSVSVPAGTRKIDSFFKKDP
uniref:DNA polymerase epsilon subunit C n=1 Tax=Erigeron canadensis TaxID=72917 RepID=UPI001CB95712|nr:DNA polymerase epsilon subunit C [Erigeron canadensis]